MVFEPSAPRIMVFSGAGYPIGPYRLASDGAAAGYSGTTRERARLCGRTSAQSQLIQGRLSMQNASGGAGLCSLSR